MTNYDKEFNDQRRRYFEKYLLYIDSEHSKKTVKSLLPEASNVCRLVSFGENRRIAYDIDLITKHFKLTADKITKIDHNGIDLFIHNEMGQSIQISFYQPEHHSNIYMVAFFEFDDYNADCQYDLFPGKNHEYLNECMSTFRKLIEIWIEEVINKFNETLGIDAFLII